MVLVFYRLGHVSVAWGLLSNGVCFPRWPLTLAMVIFLAISWAIKIFSILCGMFSGDLLDELFTNEFNIVFLVISLARLFSFESWLSDLDQLILLWASVFPFVKWRHLHVLTQLILTITPWNKCCWFHYIAEKTKAHKLYKTSSRLYIAGKEY